MSSVLPAVLLALLAGPAVGQPSPAPCRAGVVHVELPAAPTGEPPPVCISSGQTTFINFDADLAPGSLTLDGAERFSKVEPGPSAVKLVPSERVALGEPLRLTVRFRDGAAPASATLLFVAHAAQAAPLVEVHREARTVESYQQELRAKEEEARQLREELARLRAEHGGPGGLPGLFASGLMGDTGIPAEVITKGVTGHPTNALRLEYAFNYRAPWRARDAAAADEPHLRAERFVDSRLPA